MTICSGCGVVTEVTICCPICLKNNKKIFYCSQECFEQNYKEHKKIHYLINIVSREEENQNKICENKLNAVKDDLPIIVLTNEHGTHINNSDVSQNFSNNMNGNVCNDIYETSYYNNLSDSSTHNGTNNNNINVDKVDDNKMINGIMNDNKINDDDDDDNNNKSSSNKCLNNNNNNNSSSKSYSNNHISNNIIILQNEDDRSNDSSFLHLHKSDNTKNLEDTHNYNNRDYKNTRSLTFEKLHRKNNYLKYKNIKDDHLLNNTNNEDKKQQENEENEYNNKNNLHSKNSFVMKVSYYLSYICSYIFSNKYHMLLPYYDDVSLTNEKKKKKNFKSFKLKNKLSEHKIVELKKKIRIKKFVQLTLLLLLISIIVFISTYGFSYILEISQKKLQINAEQKMMFNEENKKNQEMQQIKSYINVIEDLRKEISEMKEILYVHNVILNKNFHLNNSYTLFNNKMKSANSSYNKKGSDNLGALTSHYYYDDTSSSYRDININNNNNGNNNNDNINYMDAVNINYVPTITQNEYDIKELYPKNQNSDQITLEKEKNYFDKKLSKEETKETMSDIHSIPHNNRNKEDIYNNDDNNNNIKDNTEKILNSTISQLNEHSNIEIVKTNNQNVNENINNYIKNHKQSISHNAEYAQVSNAIVNEEDNKYVDNKIILENMNNIKNTGTVSMDINNVSNNNFIHSHQIKDKYLNTSSKMEESDKPENGDRKVTTNKMNKKKQNTI
ncbi:hypothetical protein PFMG_03096 [Plasmodium falciparum IGH-CR14]|uniref:C6H2-type domain-containing protein n=3 Tax=Plasmodium falciparum TaxID=5833 RepID=A0A0L1ID33_PLAFA|nr:hypothetical protein PFMG_03096 [Plasmodium falciparum IGH-CR14]